MVEFCKNFNYQNFFLLNKFLGNTKKVVNSQKNILSILNYCQDCSKHFKIMSSIPQGMFAAKKLRENQDISMTVARINIGENSNNSKKYFHTKLMELTPLKYNSKLMNSIWGLYNRYSPHNIKSTINDSNGCGDLQQIVANLSKSAAKDGIDGATKLTGKVQNSNNVPNFESLWNHIPISQSQ